MGAFISRILKWGYRFLFIPVYGLFFRFFRSRKQGRVDRVLINLGDHWVNGLGDNILLSVIPKMVRHRYPHAEVTFIMESGNKWGSVFWKDHSFVDRLLVHPPIDGSYTWQWIKFLYALRKMKFDLSMIHFWQRPLERWYPLDVVMSRLCGIKQVIGWYNTPGQELFFDYQITVEGPHFLDMAREYAIGLGIPEGAIAHVTRPEFIFESQPVFRHDTNELKVCLSPGGRKRTNRRWPLQNYKDLSVRLFDKYKLSLYLIGGAEEVKDRSEIEEYVRLSHPTADIYNISNEPLIETASYIAGSHIFIGNDTGTTHLAVAVDTPVVVIFGPTDPEFWGPERVDPKHTVIVSAGLKCRPCEENMCWTGLLDCYQKSDKFRCLTGISVDTVWSVVDRKLTSMAVNVEAIESI